MGKLKEVIVTVRNYDMAVPGWGYSSTGYNSAAVSEKAKVFPGTRKISVPCDYIDLANNDLFVAFRAGGRDGNVIRRVAKKEIIDMEYVREPDYPQDSV